MEKYKYFTSFTDAMRQLVMLHISCTVSFKSKAKNRKPKTGRWCPDRWERNYLQSS